MKKYNLGIVGAGMYGKILIRYFKQDERANILWVNSASEGTTVSTGEEFGLEKWSLDYRDLLADPALDAVVIATLPYLTRSMVWPVVLSENQIPGLRINRIRSGILMNTCRLFYTLILRRTSRRNASLAGS